MVATITMFSIFGIIGLYLKNPMFGSLPKGRELKEIEKSPNYWSGQFQNIVPTARLSKDSSIFSIIKRRFKDKKQLKPLTKIPVIKNNLYNLDKDQDLVIWLGHSSYFIQFAGKRILVDPILSSHASPFPFMIKAFNSTEKYNIDDIPEVDYLLITHDHWDHLDYHTIIGLKAKVKNVVCGLGVGSYFKQWGFRNEVINEGDWFSKVEFENNFTVHLLPTRHFSGRMLKSNKTLWVGFVLESNDKKIFFSGDGGYGPHFKNIGKMFGGFDLVVMENGQYDKNWPNIHIMPEEAAEAAVDLQTKALLPGHSGKFALSNHSWDEPLKRISKASEKYDYRLITPMIGEVVDINNEEQKFDCWWENIK